MNNKIKNVANRSGFNPTYELTKRCFSKNSASSGVLIQDNKIYLYQSSPYPYDYSLFNKFVKGKIEILNIKEIK